MPSPRTARALARLVDLTPRRIVAELDRYIIGQSSAKKAVAIALRNRWRRQHTPDTIRREISPNNIILIGPTGCGKTEIARRVSKLAAAPFVKVEASKFTEVGYVGRDVESMVRDLIEAAMDLVRSERESEITGEASSAGVALFTMIGRAPGLSGTGIRSVFAVERFSTGVPAGVMLLDGRKTDAIGFGFSLSFELRTFTG